MATTFRVNGGAQQQLTSDLVVYDNGEPIVIIMAKEGHTMLCSAANAGNLFEQLCTQLGLKVPKREIHGARLG